MADIVLEAARAHTKEPEEVDWEVECKKLRFDKSFWEDMYWDIHNLHQSEKRVNARLKDNILRLEQRCARLEGRKEAQKQLGKIKLAKIQQYKKSLKDTGDRHDGWTHVTYPLLESQTGIPSGAIECTKCKNVTFYVSPQGMCKQCERRP